MNKKYDVFISYASEERGWVEKNIFRRLQRSRTADGRRPRIFFDVDKESIQLGRDFLTQLQSAILDSEKFVPVYSPLYFQKEMCKLEMQKFVQIDPTNERSTMSPVLIKGNGQDIVPFIYNAIPYTGITVPDWFERLCKGLGLTPDVPPILEFLDPLPRDIIVNNTLPPLRVGMKNNALDDFEFEITLGAEAGVLQGTLTRETKNWVTTFTDLSFSTKTARTRLIAQAEGCKTVVSDWFSVKVGPYSDGWLKPVIKALGEVVFFASGETLAVIDNCLISLFETNGDSVGKPVNLTGRVRFVKRADSLLALADWNGKLYIFNEDGESFVWSSPEKRDGLNVPGGLAIAGSDVYAGFWSGRIIKVTVPENRGSELIYAPGVQAIEAVDGSLYILGLDGRLVMFRDGVAEDIGELERTIYMLKAFPGCLVAVGYKQIYHFGMNTRKISRQALPFTGPVAVIDDVERPVLIDAHGMGVRFDADLVYRTQFHTIAGAVPASADNSGKYCVFRNTDGTYTLMLNDRIVFTHTTGALAIAPSGGICAIGDNKGIRIVTGEELNTLIKDSSGE